MVAIAVSSVGRGEVETHRVCKIVEATTAEAKSVHDEVESRVATLPASADASAVRMSEEIVSRVQEVVAYSDA